MMIILPAPGSTAVAIFLVTTLNTVLGTLYKRNKLITTTRITLKRPKMMF